MVNPAVVKYIKDAEGRGYTEAQLRTLLLRSGYAESHVDEAFKELQFRTQEVTHQQMLRKRIDRPDRRIKHRNPFIIFLLALFTAGIYPFYWLFSTTIELRYNIKSAPNPWLLVVIMAAGAVIILAFFQVYSSLTTQSITNEPDFFLSNTVWMILFAIGVIITWGLTIYYYWVYSKAIHELSKFSQLSLFFLFLFFFPIGATLAQIELNKYAPSNI